MSLFPSLLLSLAVQSMPEPPPWVELGLPEDYETALVQLEEAFAASGATRVDRLEVPPISGKELAGLRVVVLEGLARAGVQGLRAEKLADRQVRLIGLLGAGDDLIAVLPGRAGAESRRLILASPLGVPFTPLGFLDGWSASRLLADLCAHFRDHPLDHELVFVVCGGGALGHRGASHFAASQTEEELARTDAVVSLQGLGTSSLHAWFDGSDPGVMLVAAQVAARTSIPLEFRRFVDLENPGGITLSLAERAIPGIALDGIADAYAPLVRTEEDRRNLLNPLQWERSVRYVQALITEIDAWDRPLAFEAALERYQLDEDAAAIQLAWTRYRLMGPKGPKKVETPEGVEKSASRDDEETESPSESRSGRSRPADRRAEDEKQP